MDISCSWFLQTFWKLRGQVCYWTFCPIFLFTKVSTLKILQFVTYLLGLCHYANCPASNLFIQDFTGLQCNFCYKAQEKIFVHICHMTNNLDRGQTNRTSLTRDLDLQFPRATHMQKFKVSSEEWKQRGDCVNWLANAVGKMQFAVLCRSVSLPKCWLEVVFHFHI